MRLTTVETLLAAGSTPDDFDPVSTFITALVASVLTAVFAGYVASQQERGKRHFAARQAIRDVVMERVRDIYWFRHHLGPVLSEVEASREETRHFSDEAFTAAVLLRAEELAPWRRPLVRRRLRRLFGESTVQVAKLNRTGGEDQAFALYLARIRESEEGTYVGVYRRAVAAGHESKQVRTLERQLRRLAASR